MIKGRDVFIAPNATIIGQVSLGDECSIWFNAVLRGDNDLIEIGARTNIQDLSMVHTDEGIQLKIGHDCIIGHRAIIHGCTIGNHTLVGMGAIIMNHAIIGDYCMIGANTLVTEGMKIPDFSVVVGSPARIIKEVSEEQKTALRKNAEGYVLLTKKYLDGEIDINS